MSVLFSLEHTVVIFPQPIQVRVVAGNIVHREEEV